MLLALAVGVDSVVRVAPHDDVQDLVNDAVGHCRALAGPGQHCRALAGPGPAVPTTAVTVVRVTSL